MNPIQWCSEKNGQNGREPFAQEEGKRKLSDDLNGGCPICTTEQSINNLLQSIALAETNLAGILDAEGEKIKKAIEISESIDDLLEINRSVNKTITNVIQLEQDYYQKLDVINDLCQRECRKPCEAAVLPHSPEQEVRRFDSSNAPDTGAPSSLWEFSAVTECLWISGTALKFKQKGGDESKGALCYPPCASSLLLPAGRKYKVSYELILVNESLQPVTVDMKLCRKNNILLARTLFLRACQCHLKGSNVLILEVPRGYPDCTLHICLLSSENLRVAGGKIQIAEV